MTIKPPKFKVLSVDPGSNMGICVSLIDPSKNTMLVLTVFTLNLDKLVKQEDYQLQLTLNKKQLVERRLTTIILQLLDHYDIDVVVYESAYNSRSLMAYEWLLFYGDVIKRITQLYDYDTMVHSISPSTVKRLIGVSGQSGDKQLMYEAVNECESIKFNKGIDVTTLTEHAVDSIAIGFSVLADLMTNLKQP